MADFGESGFSLHTRPGFVLAGIEAAKRRGLSAVGKAAGVGEESQQDGDSTFAEAGNAVEQFTLALEVGIGIDVLVDGRG